ASLVPLRFTRRKARSGSAKNRRRGTSVGSSARATVGGPVVVSNGRQKLPSETAPTANRRRLIWRPAMCPSDAGNRHVLLRIGRPGIEVLLPPLVRERNLPRLAGC